MGFFDFNWITESSMNVPVSGGPSSKSSRITNPFSGAGRKFGLTSLVVDPARMVVSTANSAVESAGGYLAVGSVVVILYLIYKKQS